jgi:hypothetical protein
MNNLDDAIGDLNCTIDNVNSVIGLSIAEWQSSEVVDHPESCVKKSDEILDDCKSLMTTPLNTSTIADFLNENAIR